ncbi:antitermination protein NusB, partial [Clostridium botulinum C str. Stockholm]
FVEDIPEKVAVNEGIELAKKYSAENSPAFINGVLGNMMKIQK